MGLLVTFALIALLWA
jgi:multidrug resistance efflux pump